MQRYTLFPNRQNFFGEIFNFYAKKTPLLTNIKTEKGIHIINIYKGGVVKVIRVVRVVREGRKTLISDKKMIIGGKVRTFAL